MSSGRTLLIMRHAKSSWKDDSLPDEERPLNKRGKAAASFMGEFLREHKLNPDVILCSSAVRARETAKRLAKAGKFEADIDACESLYFSGANAYVDVIAELGDALYRPIVIGHNPDVEALVRRITGEPEQLPTGAIAQIDVETDSWSTFGKNPEGRLVNVFRPRALQESGDE